MMDVRLGLVQGCAVPNNRSSRTRDLGRGVQRPSRGRWWLEARQVGTKRRHPVYISEPHACAADAVSWDGSTSADKRAEWARDGPTLGKCGVIDRFSRPYGEPRERALAADDVSPRPPRPLLLDRVQASSALSLASSGSACDVLDPLSCPIALHPSAPYARLQPLDLSSAAFCASSAALPSRPPVR